MVIKNIHEKLMNSIQAMLIDLDYNMPFYGHYCLHLNFHEQETIGTCAVNVTNKGMNFYYNSSFMDRLTDGQSNFLVLHEIFHLLFNHPKRTITGQYDHKLSNIAQDMIINHIIWEDISHKFVEIPKSEDGKNMALFVPKEYNGNLIFEELYEWLKEKKEQREQEKQKNGDKKQDQDGDGDGDKSYGPNGKNPTHGKTDSSGKKDENETIDTYSLDKILDDLENGGDGEYLDKHIGDEVSNEMKEAMVKDVVEKLQARGLTPGNVEETLNKLRKKRKDYLKEIKRAVSTLMNGTNKERTIVRPNRKGILGLKGNRKVKTCLNVILDTSGSMGNTFEKVLSYVYRSDITVNMIQADTEVKWVEKFMSDKKIERMKISGMGGTLLTPAIDYCVEHFNDYPTVVLSDGYCDHLDISKLRHKVLIISIGVEVPIAITNGKLKQILVDLNQ